MAAKKGRTSLVRMTESHRDKIRNSNVLSHLIDHAEGKRDMTATQVTAALGLLKKALPDLQSVQHSGDESAPVKVAIEWQRAE